MQEEFCIIIPNLTFLGHMRSQIYQTKLVVNLPFLQMFLYVPVGKAQVKA